MIWIFVLVYYWNLCKGADIQITTYDRCKSQSRLLFICELKVNICLGEINDLELPFLKPYTLSNYWLYHVMNIFILLLYWVGFPWGGNTQNSFPGPVHMVIRMASTRFLQHLNGSYSLPPTEFPTLLFNFSIW